MVFSVVMYGCESWTVKKAERQIISRYDADITKNRLLRKNTIFSGGRLTISLKANGRGNPKRLGNTGLSAEPIP